MGPLPSQHVVDIHVNVCCYSGRLSFSQRVFCVHHASYHPLFSIVVCHRAPLLDGFGVHDRTDRTLCLYIHIGMRGVYCAHTMGTRATSGCGYPSGFAFTILPTILPDPVTYPCAPTTLRTTLCPTPPPPAPFTPLPYSCKTLPHPHTPHTCARAHFCTFTHITLRRHVAIHACICVLGQ